MGSLRVLALGKNCVTNVGFDPFVAALTRHRALHALEELYIDENRVSTCVHSRLGGAIPSFHLASRLGRR